jgi:hypothetical protein
VVRWIALAALAFSTAVIAVIAGLLPVVYPAWLSVNSSSSDYDWDQWDALHNPEWLREYLRNGCGIASALLLVPGYSVLGFMYRSVTAGVRVPILSVSGSRFALPLLAVVAIGAVPLSGMWLVAARVLPSSSATAYVKVALFDWWGPASAAAAPLYNLLFLWAPFLVGLHLRLLGGVPAVSEAVAKGAGLRLRELRPVDIVVLLVIGCVITALFAAELALLFVGRILLVYTILAAFFAIAILAATLVSVRWFVIVPRAWILCLALALLCRVFNPISSATFALAWGLMVERVARLGPQMPWVPRSLYWYRKLYRVWLYRDRSVEDADDAQIVDMLDNPQMHSSFNRLVTPLESLESREFSSQQQIDDALHGPQIRFTDQ